MFVDHLGLLHWCLPQPLSTYIGVGEGSGKNFLLVLSPYLRTADAPSATCKSHFTLCFAAIAASDTERRRFGRARARPSTPSWRQLIGSSTRCVGSSPGWCARSSASILSPRKPTVPVSIG